MKSMIFVIVAFSASSVLAQGNSFRDPGSANKTPLSFDEQVSSIRTATKSSIDELKAVLPRQKQMVKAIKSGKIIKSTDVVAVQKGRYYFQSRDLKNKSLESAQAELKQLKDRLDKLESGASVVYPSIDGTAKMKIGQIGMLAENNDLNKGASVTFQVDTVINKNRILMKGRRFVAATRYQRERYGEWLFMVEVDDTSGLVTNNRPGFKNVFEVAETTNYIGETMFVLKSVDDAKLKKLADAVN